MAATHASSASVNARRATGIQSWPRVTGENPLDIRQKRIHPMSRPEAAVTVRPSGGLPPRRAQRPPNGRRARVGLGPDWPASGGGGRSVETHGVAGQRAPRQPQRATRRGGGGTTCDSAGQLTPAGATSASRRTVWSVNGLRDNHNVRLGEVGVAQRATRRGGASTTELRRRPRPPPGPGRPAWRHRARRRLGPSGIAPPPPRWRASARRSPSGPPAPAPAAAPAAPGRWRC